MKDELIRFLTQFDELNPVEIQELAALMTVKKFKKNSIVVTESQKSAVCYFVLSGCLRQYVVQDGVEKTIALFTENQAINFSSSQQQPQLECLVVALEDSVLLAGNPQTEKDLYEKYPVLLEVTRRMIEADLQHSQHALAKVITLNAEQRYLELLHSRPDLFQRVPQNIIASYLGVTPESLSRIRRRLAQRQKSTANRVG